MTEKQQSYMVGLSRADHWTSWRLG